MPRKRKTVTMQKRIKEISGVKQEDLAERMGIYQKSVSDLGNAEKLTDKQFEAIAKALSVSVEAIKNFSEEAALNIISNSFTSNDTSTLNAINYQCSFNPVDKIVELFERLLKAEHEKINLLQEVLKERK